MEFNLKERDAVMASLTLVYDGKLDKFVLHRDKVDCEMLRDAFDEWDGTWESGPGIIEMTRWVNELMDESYARIIDEYGDEVEENFE